MKIKIIEDIKLAISPRENKQFLKGDEHDLIDIVAKRLIELNKAELVELEEEEKIKPKKSSK